MTRKRTIPSVGLPLMVALALAFFAFLPRGFAEAPPGGTNTRVVSDDAGQKLLVDGKETMVFGMNWDYMPIGENYNYSIWNQPDELIEAALAREMPLLRAMGVNAIRQYAGIPPRWVRHIYERYGIYTVVNPLVARYGYTLDGVWIPSVDYSDARLRAEVKADVVALVKEFRGTPGVLMWLLGNENNYGLSWTSFEIEALPEGERDAARARHLYSLLAEITSEIKRIDSDRPVAMANGDLQYIDIIAEECTDLDVFGVNCYRGISARDLFQVVREKMGIPVMFTEFGSDAYNAKEMSEDQEMQ
ncbi:MAG: glycosidase, partial [Candidatus Latescibacterota bacterium]